MSIYKKEKSYYIDYYAHGKRKREKIGPSRKLAESVLAKRKLAMAENRFLDIKKASKTTFYELCDLYIELHAKPNKRDWRRSDLLHQRRSKEFFGNARLHTITQEQVEQYKAKRLSSVSPATVNRELSSLKHMFNKAIEWGKVEINPAHRVKKLRENNARLRYLEKEEIKTLIDNSNATLQPVLVVAVSTGMRRGEILNLKWRDIDINKGIIYVLRTKNHEAREVPMCDTVKQIFIKTEKRPNSPFIFCRKNGKPYGKLDKSFLQALNKSGILNFRFHDLRHTFASQFMMAGGELNTLRELLGHKDIKMTLRYSHLSRDHKRRAMENFGLQMDTFWTPTSKTNFFDSLRDSHNSLKNKTL
ncbi:MAG: site-specific integrase [Candidatus Omnitrophica bacterium]|nr:site-specific integrase [Candidatus Omnitrophota bacterium]